MEYRTIRDILTNAEKCFGNEDAIRYKTGKNEIAAKTYTQLKEDSERITALLKKLGDPKSHIALIGATSYLWIASYFGIVDGGNVAVPLDVSLPAEELCELIDRADVTILILDEIQSGYGRSGKFFAHQYAGIKPDIIIGCAGGGSNLGGLISPFMGEKLRGEADYHFIAVEPASCPSLTRGKYVYDFCDTGKVCPMAKMYTLGSGFIPSANHAGGLRYHGMSSIVSELYDQGLICLLYTSPSPRDCS